MPELSRPLLSACMILLGSCTPCDHDDHVTAQHVSRVIQQHREIFDAETQAAASYAENLARSRRQVEQVRGIDTSQCPADFRVAFLDHCHALEDFVRLLPQDKQDAIGLIAVAGLMWSAGDAKAAVDETVGEYRRTKDRIRETWKLVELIAVRYGARLDPVAKHELVGVTQAH